MDFVESPFPRVFAKSQFGNIYANFIKNEEQKETDVYF